MKVNKDELLHIAKLADLKIEENEIDKYLANLQDILNYVDVLDSVDLSNCEEAIGVNDNVNVFRKDEVKEFDNHEGLLKNSKEVERDMFKIPKVIN